ncbi:Large neutral amino acids transporter small subunit 2 [Aphelenchoides fujianensis]|nr:Large neutral amino acids transporter small subunit 2 [Aphelenchoides fujianensis]
MLRVLSHINPYWKTPIPAVPFTSRVLLFLARRSRRVCTPRPLQVSLVWPVIFLLGCLFLSTVGMATGIGGTRPGLPVYGGCLFPLC